MSVIFAFITLAATAFLWVVFLFVVLYHLGLLRDMGLMPNHWTIFGRSSHK